MPIIIQNKWHIPEKRNLGNTIGCKSQYYKKYWLLANFDFWLFSITVHLGMSNRDRRKAILTAPGDLKLSFRLQRKNNNDTDLKVRSCLKNDQSWRAGSARWKNICKFFCLVSSDPSQELTVSLNVFPTALNVYLLSTFSSLGSDVLSLKRSLNL